jgi:hypothetical protein
MYDGKGYPIQFDLSEHQHANMSGRNSFGRAKSFWQVTSQFGQEGFPFILLNKIPSKCFNLHVEAGTVWECIKHPVAILSPVLINRI